MKNILLFPTLIVLGLSITTSELANSADDFETASTAACEKFKSCAMAEMAGQEGITPQMKQMLEGMIAGVCDNMMNMGQVEQFNDLREPATACMNSMARLSCKQLDGDVETDECKTFEKLAKQYRN